MLAFRINLLSIGVVTIETFNNAEDLNTDTKKEYLNKLKEIKNRVEEKKCSLIKT